MNIFDAPAAAFGPGPAIDIALTMVIYMTGIMNLAVLRDYKIIDNNTTALGRRIYTAGMFVLAIRFTYLVYINGELQLPWITVIGLSMISVGSLLFTAARIHERWEAHRRQQMYDGPERRQCAERRSRGRADRRQAGRRADKPPVSPGL